MTDARVKFLILYLQEIFFKIIVALGLSGIESSNDIYTEIGFKLLNNSKRFTK